MCFAIGGTRWRANGAVVSEKRDERCGSYGAECYLNACEREVRRPTD